ncbi:MAG: polysaccharide biosynthesis/export family protein [Gemmatimonadota bacterium]
MPTKGRSGILVLGLLALVFLGQAHQAAAQAGPLKPGDVVRISLSREPDMSGDYPVDELGNVGLPLVGMKQVTGVPVDVLRRDIVAAYEEQLQNQTIQVVFLRRVRVLGEVRNPGLYHVDPTMSVVDAVALAGGPTAGGTLEDVRIVRGGAEFEMDLTQPVSEQVESGDQIVVRDRGWWSRNGRYVIGVSIPFVALAVREAIRD